MADTKQESDAKKRRVKNPETFRERAVKAAVESEKPKRGSAIKAAPGRIIRPVSNPIGKSLRALFKVQPFKSIAWVFRMIGKILVPKYLRGSWQELKLVSWPNWQQSRQLTFAVLAFAIVFGGVVASVDYGLDKLFKQILLK